MPIIKPSTAFKQSADWVSAEVRAYMKDQVSTHVDTVQDVRDNDFELTRFIYVRALAATFRLDPSSGAADDGETVLRDNIGRRYLRIETNADVNVVAERQAREAADDAINLRIDEEVSTLSQEIEAAAEGTILAATWAELNGVSGTRSKQPGRVPVTDTGTHTDPVIGGTVPNSGEYSWSASPAGWQRVGAVFDPAAPTAAINLSSIGVRAATAELSGVVWTISWTQARGVWGGTVITIADLPPQTVSSTEVIYVDLVSGSSPYTPVKATISPSLRNDFAAGRKLMLVYNQTGSLVGAMAPFLLAFGGGDDGILWDPNEIGVHVLNTGEIRIYQKGDVPSSNRYVYWRLSHLEVPDDAPGPSPRPALDVWVTNGVFEATRTAVSSFVGGTSIVSTGNNELAISIVGMGTVGGQAHGYEKLNRPAYLLMDGVKVSISPAQNTFYRCRKLELLQETNLYRIGTPVPASEVIAVCQRRQEWANGEMILENRITFNVSLTISFCYLAMLSLLRKGSGDVQISDEGFKAPDWALEDISEPGFTMTYSKGGYIKASGPSGFGAEVEILDGWDKPNRSSTISNATYYNKFYFDFVSQDVNYVTQPGEVLYGKSRYRVMTRN